MKPFADFTFFGLLLYVAIPAIILGLFGRANARWTFLCTLAFLGLQFHDSLDAGLQRQRRIAWYIRGYEHRLVLRRHGCR